MIYRCAVKSFTVLTGVRLGEHRAQWCSCLYLGIHEMLKRRLLMDAWTTVTPRQDRCRRLLILSNRH